MNEVIQTFVYIHVNGIIAAIAAYEAKFAKTEKR